MAFDWSHTDDRVLITDDAFFLQQPHNIGNAFTRPFFALDGDRPDAYYRPLVTVSFILDALRGQMRPQAFHLTNVLIHGLACALLLLLLVEAGFSFALACGGSLAFALHPALTEAVIWIPGRCDTLLGVFGFAAILAFIRYTKRPQLSALLLHGLLWAAALLTKEAALAIPPVLIAWVLLVEQRRGVLRRSGPWLLWFILFVGWLIARQSIQHNTTPSGVSQRFSTFITHLPALLMHLGKILWPRHVTTLAIYTNTSWSIGVVFLPIIGLAIWRLHNLHRRLFLWGLAVFLLFLLPTLPVSDFLILENRLYFPTAGLVIAAMSVVQQLWGPSPAAQWRHYALLSLSAIIILFLGVTSWRYSSAFRNADSFTADAVRGSPDSPLAHLNRGIVFHEQAKLEQAAKHYHRALELNPHQPVVHNNLGLIYLRQDRFDEAEAQFRAELLSNPGYGKAHFNWALIHQRRGNLDRALAELELALSTDPDNTEVMRHLYGLSTLGGKLEAAARYRKLLELHGVEAPELRPMN